jgi:predicted TIM-barrel fold metal-dependent hydrolase
MPSTRPLRVDCHAHIIDPLRYPYVDGAGYKPRPDEVGDSSALGRTLDAHEITHALLVQPSCYGYDNRAMLAAIDESGGRFKGIAVLSSETATDELQALGRRGIVGIRLNLMQSDPEALSRHGLGALLARIEPLGWFVQIYAAGGVWETVAPLLRTAGVRLLIDHFGAPDPSRGVHQPGFQWILRLGRETGAVVKLSAPFRASRIPYPHVDVEPFVGAVIDAFGLDRCVWGSDWPFINTAKAVEYGGLLRLLERWLPRAADRERLFWKNPVRLFGFSDMQGHR